MVWFGCNLTYRPPRTGTYWMTMGPVPPIDAVHGYTNPYADYRTMQDLRSRPIIDIESPTGCCFKVPKEGDTGRFYYDQQGCIIWSLDSDGMVLAAGDVVAPTLAEFLYRVSIESRLWRDCQLGPLDLTPDEQRYKIECTRREYAHVDVLNSP